jgi:hypothetical protein
MAKTVNQFSTIEDFRKKYNELAIDVGEKSGLRTTNSSTLVDAVNSLEDKSFFFQEFVYVATAGQTAFSGDDSFGNSLEFRANRIQVFKNAQHLIEGTDFTISGASGNKHTIITLTSGATVSDKVVIYSFTGSYLGTNIGSGSGVAGQFTETAANTIYNINDSGVILNGEGSPSQTTSLQSGFNIQLAGKTYAEDDITLAGGKTLTASTLTDGTASISGGVGTGFSSITSTSLVGALTGNATTSSTTTSVSNHAVSGLSDVQTSSPQNGQLMVWNNSAGYWENQNAAATFTNEDAMDAAAGMITSATHSNITVSYDDANNTLAFSAAAQYGDSDARSAISGGDGLTYNSSNGVMAANTSNGVKINSDNIELDYEVVSNAPSGVGSTSTGHLWFVI